jgi:hypothetical protein
MLYLLASSTDAKKETAMTLTVVQCVETPAATAVLCLLGSTQPICTNRLKDFILGAALAGTVTLAAGTRAALAMQT